MRPPACGVRRAEAGVRSRHGQRRKAAATRVVGFGCDPRPAAAPVSGTVGNARLEVASARRWTFEPARRRPQRGALRQHAGHVARRRALGEAITAVGARRRAGARLRSPANRSSAVNAPSVAFGVTAACPATRAAGTQLPGAGAAGRTNAWRSARRHPSQRRPVLLRAHGGPAGGAMQKRNALSGGRLSRVDRWGHGAFDVRCPKLRPAWPVARRARFLPVDPRGERALARLSAARRPGRGRD